MSFIFSSYKKRKRLIESLLTAHLCFSVGDMMWLLVVLCEVESYSYMKMLVFPLNRSSMPRLVTQQMLTEPHER